MKKAHHASFSADRFAAMRLRLGLTLGQMALLVGASYLSVRRWEGARSIPSDKQLERLEVLSKLPRREVWARLDDPKISSRKKVL